MTENIIFNNSEQDFCYHSIFNWLLDEVFVEAVPNFSVHSDIKQPLVRKIIEEDLMSYIVYTFDFSVAEAKQLFVNKVFNEADVILPELKLWFKLWYNKWLERTQITSKKETVLMKTRFRSFLRSMDCVISDRLRYELERVSVETLIKEKEFCCVNLMAKDIVSYALSKEFGFRSVNLTVTDELRLMGVIVRRTREVARMVGKLVFIGVG